MIGYRCDGCGLVFGGCSGFDLHRVGLFEAGRMSTRGKYRIVRRNNRRCLNVREIQARGLVLVRGRWVYPGVHERFSQAS